MRIKKICTIPSEAQSERIIEGLHWMGVLSSEKATVTGATFLDTLCAQLEKLMSFLPGERDLVMLQHKLGEEWADGKSVHCTCEISILSHVLTL